MSPKIWRFLKGRIGQAARIEEACKGVDGIIWVHSASYGEFEEVRPVLAGLRRLRPSCKILATFFSPSGYEYLKDDPAADFVFYLPLPFPGAAKRFIDTVRPEMMILSVSDYWLPYLYELRRRGIPAYLVSGRFLPSMVYFKPIGKKYLDAFRTCFRKIIVNAPSSLEVLENAGLENAVLCGDPRLDRVNEIASSEWSDPVVDAWAGGRKVFVAGSTLPDEDDEVMTALANANPADKFLFIPHEQGEKQLCNIEEKVRGGAVRYTRLKDGSASGADAQVLIVDAVGMLSRLYRYGFAAFVGAGFSGGAPHSVIEPAAYGIPVCFGPNFGPQLHCERLINAGAAVAVHDAGELQEWYSKLKSEPEYAAAMGRAALSYCRDGGSTAEAICREIISSCSPAIPR